MRKTVTREELLQHLNKRLAGYGHCDGCHFAGPIRVLTEPRDNGMNWSPFVALVCGGRPAGGCRRIAQIILDDAAAEYNVLEPW
jgi:hypothetical protein